MKRVKTFRFSEADLAVLDELSEAFGGASEAETLRRLLAEGLRYRMEHCTPPVHPHFLDAIKPEAMPQEFLEYLDAVREQVGVMRPDGTAPTHYFAQVPAGGRWEAEGVAGGWAVLDKRTKFTRNGYEREV
ncbi:MAG TPA: hypothetical protein PLT35_08960 [Vicinamibacterales bacterium]|nr:hypothetical protein [Vicinamibacterales bacterium]